MKRVAVGKFRCDTCGKAIMLVAKKGVPEGVIFNGSVTVNGKEVFKSNIATDLRGKTTIGQTVACWDCALRLIRGEAPVGSVKW